MHITFGIMVHRRKILKDIQKIFAIDQLYLLAWHYVCINLNPNHTGLLCVRFGWNWPKDLKRWKCEKFGQGRPIDKFWLKNFWLMWANILSIFMKILYFDNKIGLNWSIGSFIDRNWHTDNTDMYNKQLKMLTWAKKNPNN